MSDKDKWNKEFYEQEKNDTGKAEDEGFSDNSGVLNNDMSQYARFGNSTRFYYAVVASNYVFMFKYITLILKKQDLRSCFCSSNKHMSVDLWGNVEAMRRYSNSQDAH
jgi:hypothetical protein